MDLLLREDAPTALFVPTGHPAYKKRWLDFLPKSAGIYFVTKDREVLYIGVSANIRGRWKNRSRPEKERFWQAGANSISWIDVDNVRDAYLLEDALMHRYRPQLNRYFVPNFDYSSTGWAA